MCVVQWRSSRPEEEERGSTGAGRWLLTHSSRSSTCPPDMLSPPSVSGIPLMSPIRLCEIRRCARKIMIPALELLQVLIIYQSLLPEILEELEFWTTGPCQGVAQELVVCHMFHPIVPRRPPIIPRVLELGAQWTLDRPRRFLSAEMGKTVRPPLFLVIGYV